MALGFCTVVHAQQIYGWTDASGEVTYSNLPPPKGATVTDVIPDTPMSPQAVQEAARRAEMSALKDRIRLLELELERNKREVVDYAGAPPSPTASLPCTGDITVNCDPTVAPYYTSGVLYGIGRPWRVDGHYGNGHGAGHPPHAPLNGPPPSARAAHVSTSAGRSAARER